MIGTPNGPTSDNHVRNGELAVTTLFCVVISLRNKNRPKCFANEAKISLAKRFHFAWGVASH
jgi:hypothetical protein